MGTGERNSPTAIPIRTVILLVSPAAPKRPVGRPSDWSVGHGPAGHATVRGKNGPGDEAGSVRTQPHSRLRLFVRPPDPAHGDACFHGRGTFWIELEEA